MQERGPIEARFVTERCAPEWTHLRACKSAALLKPCLRALERGHIALPPRLQERGPIEANPPRASDSTTARHLRACKSAALLKRHDAAQIACGARDHRACKSAALLKQCPCCDDGGTGIPTSALARARPY